jgi:Mg2+/citrate symporter
MTDDYHPRRRYPGRCQPKQESEPVELNTEAERSFVADLEKMGETQVRSLLDRGQISPRFVHVASVWLSDREREAKRRIKASQFEHIEIARRASDAAVRAATAAERAATAVEEQAAEARRANKTANTALTIAIISTIITVIIAIVSIVITHWGAHK